MNSLRSSSWTVRHRFPADGVTSSLCFEEGCEEVVVIAVTHRAQLEYSNRSPEIPTRDLRAGPAPTARTSGRLAWAKVTIQPFGGLVAWLSSIAGARAWIAGRFSRLCFRF